VMAHRFLSLSMSPFKLRSSVTPIYFPLSH
jgi:hypothetical protein